MVATVTCMLTSSDDFPLHQSALPMAYSVTSDANHYDRYFFNGYSPTGDTYFAVALGLYPNRHVIDGAFSVIHNGQQFNLFASGRAPIDRRDATAVGPLRIDVVTPLHRLRVSVDSPEHGLAAELEFISRSPAIEEPHFYLRAGNKTFLDYTRMTQFGGWTGWIEIDGNRIDVDGCMGSRDRSWGVRPVGEASPVGAPVMEPQFFWLWAPVNFPSLSTHFDTNEFGDGRRWHQVGAIARCGSSDRVEPEMMHSVDYRLTWRAGTRWVESFEYDLIDEAGETHTVQLRPRYEFQMKGLGYGHAQYGHGCWKGESLVASERYSLPVDDPCSRENVHIQALCDATYRGPNGQVETGVGILEQLVIGPHPTGLRGILDPYQTP